MKKKNNYKPRMQSFVHCHSLDNIMINTRKGIGGFYPGDEIKYRFGSGLFLGISKSYSGDMCVAITQNNNSEFFHFIGVEILKKAKLVKRHAQHLIDSGEMIQAE